MTTLRLRKRPDGSSPAAQAIDIGPAGVTIGRAPECELVIDDLLRGVSRRHAWVGPGPDGGLMVRCLSTTASLTVNGDVLASGGERAMRPGDLLRIGGFEMTLESDEPATMVVTRVARSAPPAAVPAQVPAPRAAEAAAPLVAPAVAPAVAPLVAPLVAPAVSGKPDPIPFPASSAAARAAGAAAPADAPAPPRDAPPSRRGRLDEWFDLGNAADPLGPNSPLPGLDGAGGARDRPGAAAPATPAAPARAPAFARSSPAPMAASAPAAPRVAMPVPDEEAVDLAIPLAESAPPQNDEALRLAFLRGAGLPSGPNAPALALDAATLEHLGALLRAATEGTLALLRSRAVAKRSIRAEGTRIAAKENNPLKFAPDAGEALALLLRTRSARGFLDPIEAMQDAHKDLQVHQLAMVAGMRAAVFELISRLGTGALDAAQGPPRGFEKLFPSLRDAALWRRHREQHAHLLEHLDDDFEAIFGREFVRAYEEQSRLANAGAADDEPLAPG